MNRNTATETAVLPDTCSALLGAMVGCDTVNGHISDRPFAERALAEYLEAVARQMGLTTRRLPIDEHSYNLLVTYVTNEAAPWLLFESHMDTVAVTGMSIDPFAARISDGRMYGRGACDTKGSGAAMLWALQEYATGQMQPNNIAIAYVADEEIRKTGVLAMTQTQLPAFDWRPTGVIVGEPTRMEPITAHNGVIRWSLRTTGTASHSCDPSRGRSAISMMMRVIDILESTYIPSLTACHPLTGKAQCSINVIHGGAQINMIPDSCVIHIDRRIVPGEDWDAVIGTVQQLLDQLRVQYPQLIVEQEDIFKDPPLDPAGGESFISTVGDVLQQMQMPATPLGVAYATDASQYKYLMHLPAVVLGPGDIAQAHTHDEWLELDQLNCAVRVYRNLMGASYA